MDDKTKNIIYTKADIEKYLQGKMSFAEMHNLELAALDDPFLSDAIEGYREANQKESQENIALIEANILNKQQSTPINSQKSKYRFNYLRVAASILAISIVSFFVYKITSTNNINNIQKEIADNIQSKNKSGFSVDNNQKSDSIKEENKSQEIISNSSTNTVKKNDDKANRTSSSTEQVIQSNNTLNQNQVVTADILQETTKRDDDNKKDAITVSPGFQNSNLASNAVTYSNNDIAKFTRPRSGYSNENATANNINLPTIKLKADSSVGPIGLTSFVSKAKKETRQTNYKFTKEDSLAVPANGWAAFNEYVKNNTNSILITDTTKQNISFKDSRTGEDIVDLEFFIDKDGKPNQITVARSTNPSNDTTAINLLKNGPKWISLKKESSKKKSDSNDEKKKAKVSIKINQ